MMKKDISYLFACLGGMLLLASCTTIHELTVQPESPEVLLVDITPLDTTMFEQRLQVDLRVRNPNDFDLEVTGIDFTLHLNDQRLARGLSSHASTIPRLGDAVLSVETTTSTFDILRQFLNLRERQDVDYQIDGVVYVQGARLPFEKKGDLLDASEFTNLSPLDEE